LYYLLGLVVAIASNGDRGGQYGRDHRLRAIPGRAFSTRFEHGVADDERLQLCTITADYADQLPIANGIEAAVLSVPMTLQEYSAEMCGGGSSRSEGFPSLDDITRN
jgi:hypothetical protein